MKYYMSLINDDGPQDHNQMINSNRAAMINGPRPSPLKISKDSHGVHKPSDQNKPRRPVIIYTHSPKIIHTQAHDFRALVQRLTGLSSGVRRRGRHVAEPSSSSDAKSDNDSSTVTAEDVDHRPYNSFADIPLFTPSGVDLNFFCSPRSPPETAAAAAASVVGSSLSPTVLEFMKGLPEY